MRKYFTSGLAILAPILLTVMIVNFLINFFTSPFLASTEFLLEQVPFFQSPFVFHQATLITLSSKILILLFLSSFIILIGFFGRNFLIDVLCGNYLLQKLPFINKIYKTCQDVVHSLFSSSSEKFSQVVFVPFPNRNNLSIGLVTSNSIRLKNCQQEPENLFSVFIPGTPNPTVGFMLMFKEEDLLRVNIKVDEALKFIVSCGVVMPNFEIVQPNEAYEKHYSQSDILSCERQPS